MDLVLDGTKEFLWILFGVVMALLFSKKINLRCIWKNLSVKHDVWNLLLNIQEKKREDGEMKQVWQNVSED